jgi:membrane protease YdiL (CAAX protease family)
MSDPTHLVLTLCFAMAFISAVAFGYMRKLITQQALVPPALPQGKVAVWFYQKYDLLGALIVFLIFGGLFLLSMTVSKEQISHVSAGGLVANMAFQGMIAGGVCVFALQHTNLSTWLGLRWQNWPHVFWIAPSAVLMMWFIFYAIDTTGYTKWMESLGAEPVQDTVEILQTSKDPLVLGLMIFTAVVLAPVCEEIVFRGYFYPVLKKFSGMWPAAFISALVFGAAHANLTVLLPLFLLGCLLVWIYEKTGSLWATIAIHLCFNGATVALQMAARFYDLPIQHNP